MILKTNYIQIQYYESIIYFLTIMFIYFNLKISKIAYYYNKIFLTSKIL